MIPALCCAAAPTASQVSLVVARRCTAPYMQEAFLGDAIATATANLIAPAGSRTGTGIADHVFPVAPVMHDA